MSNHERERPRPVTGDPALERAWRQASDELPPPQVDAAIIAAARKAIQDRDAASIDIHASRPSRNWLMRWQPLAAAAGVAGLAFILVQSLPREREVAPTIRMEEPVSGRTAAPESSASAPTPEAKQEKTAVATEPASAEAPVAIADSDRTTAAVPPPPPASLPRSELPANSMDTEASSGDADERSEKEFERQTTTLESSSEAAAEAATAPARHMGVSAPLSAEDRAARIEALYVAGDVAGAAAALRAFRLIEPDADAYLSEALRDWARSVE